MFAILQMADTPQIESTAVMLRRAGYDEIKVCGRNLRDKLKSAGCDTVLAVSQMVSLGYDRLEGGIEEATVQDMDRCDLFVEIKIRNVLKVLKVWPRLTGKICYWRVNGSQPEICPNGGDEINLVCPVISACFWYGTKRYHRDIGSPTVLQDNLATMDMVNNPPRAVTAQELLDVSASVKMGASGMAYSFWPPYPRSAEYDVIDRKGLTEFDDPYSLCHSLRHWGFGEILADCVKLGIRGFGNNSPAGQIRHTAVSGIAATAKALVHLKTVDCPGWALYEALLAGCPVIAGRYLISRMLAHQLLKDGETCFEFGVPTTFDYGRGDIQFSKCFEDIKEGLRKLSDPEENYRIGQAGKQRLNELMWTAERNGDEFAEFVQRWFCE